MIPLSTLTSAAFWDQAVCLDCGTIQGHLIEGDDPLGPCDECNSSEVVLAADALKIFNAIEAASGDD